MSEIYELTCDLCRCATGVVADENEVFFQRLQKELPLRIHRYPSGSEFNGWVVPQKWRVERATITKEGSVVFNGKDHTLGVAVYSKSFQGELTLDELKQHLVTNPDLPTAYMYHCMWQYRPWDADWAFSIPYEVYRTFDQGRYGVDLATIYEPGEMLVAEFEHQGRSDRTIVFNAHTCHPHMANDGFAGIAVLIRLFQWLAEQDTHYSYRLVLGPEHLGTVFYLRDLPRAEVDRMVCGLFVEMPGTQGPIKATSTFRGGHMLDQALANALCHHAGSYALVPWRKGAGNDETVWEAPGYEVPFAEVTRCEGQFAPYPEYHSSLDTPELMDPRRLEEMLEVLKRVVDTLEGNATIERQFDGLICLSNPSYDLYMERPDPAVVKSFGEDAEKWGHLLDCLFRYFDGSRTILDIALAHDLPFARLRRYLERFEEKGLVRLRFVEIPRVPPIRVERNVP